MAAPRGRGLRPGGIVRAVVRLVLLVAVGFGVGLVFGLVTEEPELLAGHLRGRVSPSPWRGGGRARGASGRRSGPSRTSMRRRRPGPASEDRPCRARGRRRCRRVAALRPRRMLPPPRVMKGVPAAPLRRDARGRRAARSRDRAPGDQGRKKTSRPWAIQVGAFSDERPSGSLRRLRAGTPSRSFRRNATGVAGAFASSRSPTKTVRERRPRG